MPELLRSGLRRGLYGASIGAKIVRAVRRRNPGTSAHNPKGLEERTYTEAIAYDVSLTSRPQFASATVAVRGAGPIRYAVDT